MAKNKKAKGKGKSKDESVLPKSIAGFKVPKGLRKSSGSLVSLIESPVGRQIVADVLIAVAGALVANKDVRKGAMRAADDAVSTGADVAGAARDAAGSAAHVIGGLAAEAARQILPSSLTGEDEADKPSSRKRARDEARLGDLPYSEKKPKGGAGRGH